MKLNLFGNRPLILVRDPQFPMEAATKNYVDFTLENHTNNLSLHLTATQNTLLDNITVNATEVNSLAGISGNVQTQLNNRLLLSGGTLTGDLTLSTGHTVFVNRTPVAPTELVNKTYVDSLVAGQEWKNPVTDINLVADDLNAPPVSPVPFDVYIIGATPTGAWAGLARRAVFHDGTAWVQLQNRPVQANDRFGVALTSSTVVGATLTAFHRNIVTITGVAGTISYSADTLTPGTTTLVFDNNSRWFGVSYTFTDELTWVPTNTSVNISPGSGLSLSGNILNVNSGRGLVDIADFISVNVHSTSGLFFTLDGVTASAANNALLSIRIKDTTLSRDADGLFISTSVINNINDRISRTGNTTVTGTVTFDAASNLLLNFTPTTNFQAANKVYVDTQIATRAPTVHTHTISQLTDWPAGLTVAELAFLSNVTSDVQTQLNNRLLLSGGTLTGPLVLAADPAAPLQAATRQYVDAADATLTTNVNTRVLRAGDTLTGFLTLHANPTNPLHAAPRQYVDTSISTLQTAVNTADTNLQNQITTLQGTVTTLNADPVTRTYVDSQIATRVARAGDTLTGYLILHADPVNNMHPATKQYVDNVATGLSTRPSVRLATTGNLAATYVNGTGGVNATLTGTANGAITIDGVTPVVGDRILVRLQTAALQNGAYVVQQVGNVSSPFILRRVDAANEAHEIPGSYYYVFDGLTLRATGWVATVVNPTTFAVGVDAITINQFSGQGSIIAGNGLTITGNTIDINTASSARIVINADNIDLATTAVVPGTYTRLTVDGFGRATAGSNPNTLAGFGITDGQPLNANLTSLSLVASVGLLTRDASNNIVTRSVAVSGNGLSITNADGGTGNVSITSNATNLNTPNAVVNRDASGNFAAGTITAALAGNATTATTLQTARTFAINGDMVAAPISFDGSANITLNSILNNTGVVAGSYTSVTVDAKGRVTAGTNPTTLAGHGITDAVTIAAFNARIAELEAKIDALSAFIMSRT